MRCSDQQPGHPDRICLETDGHDGPHRDEWGVQWNDPTTGVGFSREELTAAAARQQKVAPSKDEILAAIDALQFVTVDNPTLMEEYAAKYAAEGVAQARMAIEGLFKQRGL